MRSCQLNCKNVEERTKEAGRGRATRPKLSYLHSKRELGCGRSCFPSLLTSTGLPHEGTDTQAQQSHFSDHSCKDTRPSGTRVGRLSTLNTKPNKRQKIKHVRANNNNKTTRDRNGVMTKKKWGQETAFVRTQ